MQHDERVGVRLLLALFHRNDVSGKQKAADQRQYITRIQSAALSVQRQQADPHEHHHRRNQVALLQLLMEQQRAPKRNEQHIYRRQERIFARRRILQAGGLHDVRAKKQQADQRAARHVSARQLFQVSAEQNARNRRRDQVAHGNNCARRKAVQRVFDHRKRAAPNQSGQQKQAIGQYFAFCHLFIRPYSCFLHKHASISYCSINPFGRKDLYTSFVLVYHGYQHTKIFISLFSLRKIIKRRYDNGR